MSTSLFINAIPYYLLALLAYLYLVQGLGLFPETGYYSPITEGPAKFVGGMLLPWLMIGISYSTQYSRFSRGSMVDALNEDFVRTARAKGLMERTIVRRHALRAAIVPVVTIFGLDFAGLLAGTIFTEKIFGIQGMGLAGLDAVHAHRPADGRGVHPHQCRFHRRCQYRGRYPVQRHRPEGAPSMTQTNEPAPQDVAGDLSEPTDADSDEPFLVVEDLTVRFPTADGLVQAVTRPDLLGQTGPDARHRRRVRLRQERLQPRRDGTARRQAHPDVGLHPRRRERGARPPQRQDAPDPRPRGRDDLPGPADRAAPLLQGRRADLGGLPGPPRRLQGQGAHQGHRDARPGRHPAGPHPRRRLPAPVLRRHAPARDDRDGAVQRPVRC